MIENGGLAAEGEGEEVAIRARSAGLELWGV